MNSDLHIELFLAELAENHEMQQRLQDDEQQYDALYMQPLECEELPF